MKFLILIVYLFCAHSMAASIWPNGNRLETFQSGFLFGNGETIDSDPSGFLFDNGAQFNGPFILEQQATPSAPPVGFNKLYFKVDNSLHVLDSLGQETNLAATKIRGQEQALLQASSIEAPNKTVTPVAGNAFLIETGNKNILENPGFENDDFDFAWTITGAATVSGTTSASEVLSGKKSFKAVMAGNAVQLTQDSTLYAATLANTQMFIRMVYTNTAPGAKMCVRKNGVTLSDTNDCVTLATDGVRRTAEIAFLGNGTSNGFDVDTGTTAGTLIVDDVELSTESSSFIDVAQIGPWISYTPTFQGFGTPTNIECKCRINGPDLETDCKFTTGTLTSVEARVSLCQGFISKGSPEIPSIRQAGAYANAATTTSHGGFVLIEPSVNYMTFGQAGTFGSATINALTKETDANVVSTGGAVSLRSSIPVQGLSNKVTTYSQQCVKDVDCENTFSGRSSSAGVVSAENLEWINGNCTYGSPTTNAYNCPVNSGVFTTVPNCGAIVDGSRIMGYNPAASTTTNLVFGQQNPTTNGFTSDASFTFWCHKQGADFKAKNVITGTFKDVVTSPNAGKVVLCSAKISSTGVISDQIGGCFASCTNATTPVCTFTTNYWVGIPNCWGMPSNGTNGIAGGDLGLTSNTSTRIDIYSGGLVASAGARKYFCHGQVQ